MSIIPKWLNRIAANRDKSFQFKCHRRQRLGRRLIHISEDIHLALAARAGTSSPEFFQRNEALRAILPADGKLASDLLDVACSHASQGKSISSANKLDSVSSFKAQFHYHRPADTTLSTTQPSTTSSSAVGNATESLHSQTWSDAIGGKSTLPSSHTQ